jgi:DNA polymerase III sliding clamp (beta) subunit (PCNA family)
MIEQSTSFAFQGGRIVTYNDEISLSHPAPYIDFEGAIKAEELYKLLWKLKQPELDIEVTETEILLSSGRTKAGLTLQSEIKLPLAEITEATKWEKLPTNFVEGLKFVVASASSDMSRAILTCVHINNKICESSDGYQLAHFTFSTSSKIVCLLPATSVSHIIALKPKFVSLSDGWAHFRTEADTTLSCRILFDTYPATENLFICEGHEIEFPKTISNILDRVSVFSKRETVMDEVLTIALVENKIKVKGDSDSGWIEESAKVTYSGEPIEFKVMPSLLINILTRSNICIKSENKIKFLGDNWKFLVMLRG